MSSHLRSRRGCVPITALAGALLMAPSAACGPASLPATGFHAGQAFPEIVLPSLDGGRPTSLARFRGQKVILHVFASW